MLLGIKKIKKIESLELKDSLMYRQMCLVSCPFTTTVGGLYNFTY